MKSYSASLASGLRWTRSQRSIHRSGSASEGSRQPARARSRRSANGTVRFVLLATQEKSLFSSTTRSTGTIFSLTCSPHCGLSLCSAKCPPSVLLIGVFTRKTDQKVIRVAKSRLFLPITSQRLVRLARSRCPIEGTSVPCKLGQVETGERVEQAVAKAI